MNMYCWSDPALPREIAAHCGSFYPGIGGHCRVCGCTLYYKSDIEASECAGCYGWGVRIARYMQ
jgi:hypothetical protein